MTLRTLALTPSFLTTFAVIGTVCTLLWSL